MLHRDLKAEDIEVFSQALVEYFQVTTGEAALVRSAYLLDSGEPALWNDFNGLINVTGGYRGSVCFSAPREMLSHVLLLTGEQVFTDERHSDIVGEIANTLSGRARRHFGEGLEISVPIAFPGRVATAPSAETFTSLPFAIPLAWYGYQADLVVRLDRRS